MSAQAPRIVSQVREDLDATVHTVFGDVTAAMIADTIGHFYAGTPTRHVVWDLSGAGVSALSTLDVQKLADLTLPMAPRRPGGRTALVMSSEFGYLFAEMFKAFQREGASAVEHRAFLRLDEALAWIQGA